MATAEARRSAPGSTDELAAELAGAAADGVRVRLLGAGTKRRWAPDAEPGLELSSAGLDRIVEHNAGDLTAVLEAGVPLARAQERLEGLASRPQRARLADLDGRRSRLDGAAKLLRSLSYQAALQRGYALLRDASGRSIRSAAAVTAGQRLDIELADGHVAAAAEASAGARPAPGPRLPPKPKTRAKARGGEGQGSLF